MPESEEVVSVKKEDAEREAEEAFRAVFEFGPKIELDHHLVYHARQSILPPLHARLTDYSVVLMQIMSWGGCWHARVI